MSDILRKEEAMSDLRERVAQIIRERIYPIQSYEAIDLILALFERSAVERERVAFVAGVKSGIDSIAGVGNWNLVKIEAEADRRYPLPKEE